jgi:hypothetical protein
MVSIKKMSCVDMALASALREADLLPLKNVAADTIGPWVLTLQNRHKWSYVLAIIDMVTNLTEII